MESAVNQTNEIMPTNTMEALTQASIRLIRQSRDIVSRDIILITN